jgi:hypothetical protein
MAELRPRQGGEHLGLELDRAGDHEQAAVGHARSVPPTRHPKLYTAWPGMQHVRNVSDGRAKLDRLDAARPA